MTPAVTSRVHIISRSRRRQRIRITWIVGGLMAAVIAIAWMAEWRMRPVPALTAPAYSGHFTTLAWQYRDRAGHLCATVQRENVDAPDAHTYRFYMYKDGDIYASFPADWPSDEEAMSAMAQVCDEKAKRGGGGGAQ